MRLSQNIKRLRLEKNLTQEQLAAALGVCAQAVSKWETSETYPDGSLLVPLAHQLGVSLDELFDNRAVSMADISKRILHLMQETAASERFHVARDIGWQIERGLFNCLMLLDESYNPDALNNIHNSSYIVNDYGFTLVSNGRAPFFSVFPEPACGFGETIGDGEEMRRIFACLSSCETMRAVIYLHKKHKNYVFESDVLANECNIGARDIDRVLNDLISLHVVYKKELEINGENRVLYYSHPSHKLIALFLIAHELNYKGAYSLQSEERNKPYLNEVQ